MTLRSRYIVMFLVTAIWWPLVMGSHLAHAACSCDVGTGGSFIGMELTAESCPPVDADDNTRYVYLDKAINCMGEVSLFSSWGDTEATPAWLENYFASQNLRVFRNEKGTHFIVVHTNFTGKINGLKMSDFPGGGVYEESAMNEFCVNFSPDNLDEDKDGVPACQDCDDHNSAVGAGREDQDGDGVPKCLDCNDNDNTLRSGKGIDEDKDGFDQCRDCNDDAYFPQDVPCKACTVVGHPVDYFSGTMTHDIDLINLPGSPVALSFSLHYDSHKDSEEALGTGWSHNQAIRLLILDKSVIVSDQSRRPPMFATYDQGATFYPSGATKGSLVKTADGYIYTRPDAEVLTFDQNGLLLNRKDPHGLVTDYAYNASGRLVSVTDPSQRILHIDYYPAGTPAEGLVMAVEDPAGHMFRFGYANRMLSTITYPDADEDPSNDPTAHLFYTDFPEEGLSNGGDPTNLTKLVDTKGDALSWSYDATDRAVLTSGPHDAKRLELTYQDSDTTVILNSRNEASTYVYDDETKTLSLTGPGCTSCSRSTAQKYDQAGNLIEKVDGEGTFTRYEDFDQNGNAGTVIEAAGTDQKKVIYYTYDPKFNKITSERERGAENAGDRETLYTYDQATGDLLSMTRKGYSGGALQTLTTQYSYNSRGQLVRIDGPRTDVEDVTTISYDPVTGYMLSVTQPLIGTTRYDSYDALGYPGSITDQNGNTTKFAYDARGRIIRSVGPDGAKTGYVYDFEGNLVAITQPLGNTISYGYYANRLATITDSQGNSLRFSYDSEGNLIHEEIRDMGNVLRKNLDYTYDSYNRLSKVINPDGSFSEYKYDKNNNRIESIDPGNKSTHFQYDPLNRLVRVTAPMTGITSYTYDLNQNLASVTDANGNVTTYQYDDFGRLVNEASPDSGTALYAYDPAGNLVKKIDAGGLSTTYKYDGLNRLTAVHYPDSSQDIYYTYDEGNNAKGRLTGMQDASGTVSYLYTSSGRVAKEIDVISGVRYVTGYSYDLNGNLVSLTYPDGETVSYSYNADNYLAQVAAVVNNQPTVLATGIVFAPFGGITAMNLGNGIDSTSTYDTRYRINRMQAGQVLDRQYSYDDSGNIDGITDSLSPEKSQTFKYDGLNRLTQASGGYGALSYAYDPVGNRTSRTKDSLTDTYSYTPGTNQLVSVTGSVDKSLSYDKSGKPTKIDGTSFAYNTANRLVKLIENNALKGEYVYNGQGQRVKKKVQHNTTVYHYDLFGNLIAISDANGTIKEKFIYANGQRLAKVDVIHEPLSVGDVDGNGNVEIHDAELVEQYLVGLTTFTANQLSQADVTLDGQVTAQDAMYIKQIVNGLRAMPPGPATEALYYFQNDHLGTALALTDQNGVKVWEADYLPFGGIYQETGPESQKFRFPGQYFDAETGLHYNWHRYYNPETGRYLTPDPIGLEGGINLYSYVQNNPVNWVDPWGLLSYLVSRPLQGFAGASHNFIVTQANFIGDPNATVYSFGKNKNGNVGKVDDSTIGFSAGTHRTDIAAWNALRGKDNSCQDVSQINAADPLVEAYANSLIENQDYEPIPVLFSANSNSAAQAVANRAAQSYVPTPGGDRSSPGSGNWKKIQFGISVLSSAP